MRIGVLGTSVSSGGTIGGATVGTPDITGVIIGGGGGQGSAPATTTYGLTPSGDTIACPPGYPYDPATQDCLGYIGSPGDVARTILQSDIDACTSGGGTWVDGQCIIPVSVPVPTPVPSNQLITGINNNVLYAAAGLLLVMALMGGKR